MTGMLRCLSVHSVKGGVGKSTVATLAALSLARRSPSVPVFLIDMDLTGTSLADVLPLEAPRWLDCDVMPDPTTVPTEFWDRATSLDLMEKRDLSGARHVPFLNDFLLYATPDWYAEADMPVEAVAWRIADGPSNLKVVPSSALPTDLERTLAVIFDEQHSAYLEGRLERFLNGLCQATQSEIEVVFDVPPTIPGLSRAVLSLGLRLGAAQKQPLARDDFIPAPLADREVSARALMLTTLDLQDLRAMHRWMSRVLEPEEALFKVVINRVPQGTDSLQLRTDIKDRLAMAGAVNRLLDEAEPLVEDPMLRIFGQEQCPKIDPDSAIDQLLDAVREA